MQPDNDDLQAAKEAVEEAKRLFPENETVRMLSVDFMSTEGDFAGATQAVDELIASSDGDDAIPYVFKANTTAQQAMMHLQMAQQYGNQQEAAKAKELFDVRKCKCGFVIVELM